MLKNHFQLQKACRKRFIVRIIAFVALQLFATIGSSFAQADPQFPVSIEVKNERIGSVLQRLHNDYNLNFSFNAGDSTFQTLITYQADKIPIGQVLTDLLQKTNHQFKNIDNQFVIYPSRLGLPNELMPKPLHPSTLPQTKPDTVYIQNIKIQRDTLIRVDTIILHDTVVRIDTLVVEKEPDNQKTKARIKNIRSDIFNDDARRQQGWAIAFAYFKELNDYNISGPVSQPLLLAAEGAEKWSFRTNGLSVGALYSFNRLKAEAGISYTGLASKFQFTKVNLTGGYFERDTLDAYYTLIEADTNWVYVVDSTWLPINRFEKSYRNINEIHQLDLRLGLSYTLVRNRSLDLYAAGRLGIHYLLAAQGYSLIENTEIEIVEYKNLGVARTNFSTLIALGARIKVNQALDLNPEIYYHSRLKDLFSGGELLMRLKGFGFKFGLIYYL